MSINAIIVAGGKGLRMNHPTRKQYLELAGKPILAHTLITFDQCHFSNIYLVLPKDDIDSVKSKIVSSLNLKTPVVYVVGGQHRQNSVYNALIQVNRNCKIVVVHDAVRPFVQKQDILKCITNVKSHKACILAIPAYDTLKKADHHSMITTTIDRKNIWLAQTPQAFQFDILKKAHTKANIEGYMGTDDASLVEMLGLPVKIIPGNRYNIKITDQDDLKIADYLFHII